MAKANEFKTFEIKNVSNTPLFPYINGEQVTLFPNETLTLDMDVYEETVRELNTYDNKIIVIKMN